MPRKRPWEAKLICGALLRRGKLQGYQIEALDNMTRSEVAAKLAKTQIFISLLKDEALGFPAAEAMAAGCVVVGFDGLGTAEYFDQDVGVPVTEGDVASLVTAVENTIAEYETDPRRLDAMRRKASDRVNARYNKSAFEAGALGAWRKFEETLEKME
jgi:glycosyltransferase involved in cell wall biosynthesis